jgi:hypothetical protein
MGVVVLFQVRSLCTLQKGDNAHERDQKVLLYFGIEHPYQHKCVEIEHLVVKGSSR